jgi:hypothetical protein
MRVWLAVLLLLPGVGAQVPGIEDAVTDGRPFELDAPAVAERLAGIAASISGQGVHDCVREITSDPTTAYRVMGTPTQSAFVDRHRNVFSDMGMPSALQSFEKGSAGIGPSGAALPQGGTNIVGVLAGTQLDQWIVIGGHYDTREATIGALDNGSGICSVKEIARAMAADVEANGAYEASVIFNWYDGEEWGLYGAIAFADDHTVAKELLGLAADAPVNIMVSQSYDMPGINYPAHNAWVRYGDPVAPEALAVLHLRTAPVHSENTWRCFSYGCYEELKQRPDIDWILLNNTQYQFLVREVAYDLLEFPPEYVQVHDDDYGRSDHVPLIARGAAGMRIQGSHDEQYPCYHQPCDTLEWLYVQTGGQDLLIAAYDAEASIGGTTAAFVALQGTLGMYGVEWLIQRESSLLDLIDGPESPLESLLSADQEAPGPVVPLVLVALAIAMMRRR